MAKAGSFKNPRNAAIYRERASGSTLKATGEKFGITGDRVRKICARMDRMRKFPGRAGMPITEFLTEMESGLPFEDFIAQRNGGAT